jgi:transposase
VWFQDEARIGQQGALTNVWADKGSRPVAVKQTEYDWLYLFAAVNPNTGESAALIAPTVDTQWMSKHLSILSEEVGPTRHVVLVLDGAGWHVAKALEVPGNITLLHLPPYSPELNPIERVWGYLRSHYLSNRAYLNYDELFKHTSASWRKLDAAMLRSITATQWITHEGQG